MIIAPNRTYKQLTLSFVCSQPVQASEQDRIESEQALNEKDSVIASLRQQLTNADGRGGVIKSYA